MRQLPPLVERRILRPSQTAIALDLVSRMDLLRLKAIARVYARGLPPEVTWEDLLQEALTRVIVGSRHRPQGVPTVAFVAGVLRSLKAEHWRRARRESGGDATLRIDHEHDTSLALSDPTPGPERALSARQELSAIRELFADDPAATTIIEGLGEGLSAGEIRRATGLSKTDYDSARKRIRRTLLREGLTCERK
ncbi:MAG: RNA polymerase sigma factor [Steroidobacteraceae bacterium]